MRLFVLNTLQLCSIILFSTEQLQHAAAHFAQTCINYADNIFRHTSIVINFHLAGFRSHLASFIPFPLQYANSPLMDRPVSMVAVVATLRYDQWEGPGVFHTPTEVWVSADKLYRSKRRFHLRITFGEFKELLRSDPIRIVVWDTEQTMWVRAA